MLAYLAWHRPWTVMTLCVITIVLFITWLFIVSLFSRSIIWHHSACGVIHHAGQGCWLVICHLVIHVAVCCVVAMSLTAMWHPLSEDGVRKLMLAYLCWHRPWTVMMLCIITIFPFIIRLFVLQGHSSFVVQPFIVQSWVTWCGVPSSLCCIDVVVAEQTWWK